MTLRWVFYNHLHIELHACTGHADSQGDYINIKVYKNKLINYKPTFNAQKMQEFPMHKWPDNLL